MLLIRQYFSFNRSKKNQIKLPASKQTKTVFVRKITGPFKLFTKCIINRYHKDSRISFIIQADGKVYKEIFLKMTLFVNNSKDEVYSFCRNIENLPIFITQLKTVSEDKKKHLSYWEVSLKNDQIVGFVITTINEVKNQSISWHSFKAPFIELQGTAYFTETIDVMATKVMLSMNYKSFLFNHINRSSMKVLKRDIQKLIKIMEFNEDEYLPLNTWI